MQQPAAGPQLMRSMAAVITVNISTRPVHATACLHERSQSVVLMTICHVYQGEPQPELWVSIPHRAPWKHNGVCYSATGQYRRPSCTQSIASEHHHWKLSIRKYYHVTLLIKTGIKTREKFNDGIYIDCVLVSKLWYTKIMTRLNMMYSSILWLPALTERKLFLF